MSRRLQLQWWLIPLAAMLLCSAQQLLGAERSDVDLPLTERTRVVFADVASGRELLAKEDDFLTALSPFDRQARLRTSEAVDTQQLQRHLAAQVLAWEMDEVERIEPAVAALAERLAPLKLALPGEILFIKTTGRAEAGAAHTRGAAVVLPLHTLKRPPEFLQRLLTHELFHILSRHRPQLRAELYALVGFQPCGPVQMPDSLRKRLITNPDAPRYDFFAEVDFDGAAAGRPRSAVPILLSKSESFDPQAGRSLFEFMQFKLLAVDRRGEAMHATVEGGRPVLTDGRKNAAYRKLVGANTKYIIHPEEVLADNFVHLVWQTSDLPNPEIVDGMRRLLSADPQTPADGVSSSSGR